MRRTIVSFAFSAVFILSLFSIAKFDFAFCSETIIVPTDFPTIQAAINNASDGDTVFVFNGTYLENIVVNKTIFLIGQDRSTTIIDGDGTGFAVNVKSDNVSVSGFTIQNSGSAVVQVFDVDNFNLTGNTMTDGSVGVDLLNATGSYICNNTVSNNNIGIRFVSCDGNTVTDNNLTLSQDASIFISYSSSIVVNSNFLGGNGQYGLYLEHSSSISVIENLAVSNGIGIRLEHCTGNTVIDNDLTGNDDGGLSLYYSTSNVINGNIVSDSGFGMRLSYSGDNTLRENQMVSNDYNFEVESATLSSYVNDIDTSNTVDGRQVFYLVNQENFIVNSSANAGYVAVVNSTGIQIRDLNLAHNGEGVLCAYSGMVVVENCTIIDNLKGVYVYDSNYTIIRRNTIMENLAEGVSMFECLGSDVRDNLVTENAVGIFFYYLTNSSVVRNNVTANFERGIQMLGSNFNILSQNSIENNSRQGIYAYNSNNNLVIDNQVIENLFDGIWLDTTENNTLAENNVSWNNGSGIYMLSSRDCQIQYNQASGNKVIGIELSISDNNTIRGNEVSENLEYGIQLYDCSNNRIFQNNFSNQTYHAKVFLSSHNYWDNGYPEGGNFWDDYSGGDIYSGPYQNLTGSDGIGDIPVIIGSDNVDRYPVLTMISLHDITIFNATVGCDEQYVGWTIDVGVTVKNYGDYVETFNVTVYADEITIKTFNVSNLLIGNSITLTFAWNTSNLTPCHSYTVKCEADVVAGETNVEDNVCVAGIVKIKMFGDVNGDGTINIIDIATIAISFGSNVGDDNYHSICDLNKDGTINILDLSSAAIMFGRSCPA